MNYRNSENIKNEPKLSLSDVNVNGNLPAKTINRISQQSSKTALKSAPILYIKNRLLTPAEGCGYSSAAKTKIVGGSPAKIGLLKSIDIISLFI